MKQINFDQLSIDELLRIRETINHALSSKVTEERRRLELRMAALNDVNVSDGAQSHLSNPGKIPPKYRNPENPQQTWAGRGKTPIWLLHALKKGMKKEDFLIKSPAKGRHR